MLFSHWNKWFNSHANFLLFLMLNRVRLAMMILLASSHFSGWLRILLVSGASNSFNLIASEFFVLEIINVVFLLQKHFLLFFRESDYWLDVRWHNVSNNGAVFDCRFFYILIVLFHQLTKKLHSIDSVSCVNNFAKTHSQVVESLNPKQ